MAKTLDHPVKRFLGMILVVVALIVAQPFLWNFVALTAGQYNSKRTEEKQFENVQSRLVVIQTAAEAEQELLDNVDVVFPPSGTASGPVERLERLSDDSGVVLTITGIGETDQDFDGKKIPGIVKLRINFQALGTTGTLPKFMEAIEHTDELTTIDSWSIQPSKDLSGDPGLVYSLAGAVSFYLQTE